MNIFHDAKIKEILSQRLVLQDKALENTLRQIIFSSPHIIWDNVAFTMRQLMPELSDEINKAKTISQL